MTENNEKSCAQARQGSTSITAQDFTGFRSFSQHSFTFISTLERESSGDIWE